MTPDHTPPRLPSTQAAFSGDLEAAIGPQAPDGNWVAEHYGPTQEPTSWLKPRV